MCIHLSIQQVYNLLKKSKIQNESYLFFVYVSCNLDWCLGGVWAS